MKVNSVFGQNSTKARFQWKTRIFCFIFELDFINYLFTFGRIHEHFWQRKVEKHRWYLWNLVKKYCNFSEGRLGPRTAAPALGHIRPYEKFQFIFLPSFMKPPIVSIVFTKKTSWNQQKWPNNQWNQATKKCAVSI